MFETRIDEYVENLVKSFSKATNDWKVYINYILLPKYDTRILILNFQLRIIAIYI